MSSEDISSQLTGNGLETMDPSLSSERPSTHAHKLSTQPISDADVPVIANEEETPKMPVKRPTRRTITEELDGLIDSTTEQLEQIGNIVSKIKNGEITTEKSEVTQTPNIPQRPKKSINDETIKEDSESLNTIEQEEKIAPRPLSRPNNTKEALDQENSAEIQNESKYKPSEPLENIEDIEDSKEVVKQASITEKKNGQSDDNDDGEGESVGGNSRQATQKAYEDEIPNIPNRPTKTMKKEPVASNEIQNNEILDDDLVKEDPMKEESSVPERGKNEISPVKETENSKVLIQDPSMPDRPKKETQKSKFLAEEQSAPEKAKGRGPPPVPKKPSSRIAAFQKMIHEQQMQDIKRSTPTSSFDKDGSNQDSSKGNSENQKKTISDNGSEGPEPTKNPSEINNNSKRMQFANSLNGLIGLPGISSHGLPPALSKKLSNPAKSDIGSDNGGNENNKNVSNIGSQRRGKGPRGRKLPTQVASFEKIIIENAGNEIKIFNTWTLEIKPTHISSPEVIEEPIEMGTDDIACTKVEESADGHIEEQPIENSAEGSEQSEASHDYITDRDQYGVAETLEQEIEDKIEREMQQDIIDEQEKYNKSLKQ